MTTATLDFKSKELYAKALTIEELAHAIKDCLTCVQLGVNPDKYRDEISVYRREARRRFSTNLNKLTFN